MSPENESLSPVSNELSPEKIEDLSTIYSDSGYTRYTGNIFDKLMVCMIEFVWTSIRLIWMVNHTLKCFSLEVKEKYFKSIDILDKKYC